jgi:alkylation response protein AidB-like acyl-CoA dehydrogenase
MTASAAIVDAVRHFVDAEVRPVVAELEHADRYPHDLVGRMRALGLFGALVPRDYGGLGLDVTTYARVIEELCRGWMSLAGVINSHTMAALIVREHGTEAQRARWLPRFAAGEARGGLCLTEPHAGSDVQAIRTVAHRRGEEYVIDGTKMFVTNGREGNTFALLAVTDGAAAPRHRGMSCFIVEKGHPGLRVAQSIGKLGYKGVDTAELVFEDYALPADHLVGGVPGRGFKHVMSGLEAGRINIAARAVGVGQAAMDEALRQARAAGAGPHAPALADMAVKLTGARLLTYWAAAMKDRGERCDLEAGMAKLAASETAQELAEAALRIHGEAGQLTTLPAERLYRDTPLMIIGEGTNEIQRLIIARQLLERAGEGGDLTADAGGDPEARRLVRAVRQVVDKEVSPLAAECERAGRWPADIMRTVADLGLLGAPVPSDLGGLGLALPVVTRLVEELARGWTVVAEIALGHLVAVDALARSGDPGWRRRLGVLTSGERWATFARSEGLAVTADAGGLVLNGRTSLADNAVHADVFLVLAGGGAGAPLAALVPRAAAGLAVEPGPDTVGARGVGAGYLSFTDVRLPAPSVLGAAASARAEALARLGLAATGVGLAQAALEAAVRYARERTAFGRAICQHQAVQLKLADMATAITAARLLTAHAAERLERSGDDVPAAMARLAAAEAASRVSLEAMRIHGGYGYTTDFPVERYYRDAPHLVLALGGPDGERRRLGSRLVEIDGSPA